VWPQKACCGILQYKMYEKSFLPFSPISLATDKSTDDRGKKFLTVIINFHMSMVKMTCDGFHNLPSAQSIKVNNLR
jgi:hypothetical protein